MQTTSVIDLRHRAPTIAPARSSRRVAPIPRIAKIAGALLIQVILIGLVVAANLGLGVDSHAGAGPQLAPPLLIP